MYCNKIATNPFVFVYTHFLLNYKNAMESLKQLYYENFPKNHKNVIYANI